VKVVIAGGGIGGLAAALVLHEAGVEVTVFEAVRTPAPLGVGINILPHAIAELDKLGILDELLPLGVPTAELCYANRHGQFVWREPRGLAAGYPEPQLSVHRGRLQLALLDIARRRLGDRAIRTGCRVVDFHQSPRGLEIDVIDRRRETAFRVYADVLVGADGIHSMVRALLFPHEGPPQWSGEMLWRATTVQPPFLSGRSMVMIGSRRCKAVIYPISPADSDGNALINWIAVLDRSSQSAPAPQDWNRLGHLDDFIGHFAGWSFDWLDVVRLMQGAEATYVFPMVDRDPLPQWSFGAVTLLGDAAHPMYPIGSNGASQAILDARALATALRGARDPTDALRRYEDERSVATARVVAANRGHGAARILDLAEERAPDGFASVDDVFAPGELEAISAQYRNVAGFSQRHVASALETGDST
jgi:2-polyprenyl-6-methoxyphenol hydroxylase-like FAD-dependent oxidoreductase